MKIFTTQAKPHNSWLKSLAVLSGWIFLWWIISLVVDKEYLIPQPHAVALRLVELGSSARFWGQVIRSCSHVLFGFWCALWVGFLLGTLCYFIPPLHTIFRPILTIITTTPVASFIILAIVWLQSRQIPVFITFLMVTPLVWNNVYKGLSSTSRDLLEMAFVYRVPFVKKWTGIYLPSVMPYFTAAVQTGIGFAWKAGIAAEVIALPRETIGKEIYNAKLYVEATDLVAWTIVVICLSFLFQRLSVGLLTVLSANGERGRIHGASN